MGGRPDWASNVKVVMLKGEKGDGVVAMERLVENEATTRAEADANLQGQISTNANNIGVNSARLDELISQGYKTMIETIDLDSWTHDTVHGTYYTMPTNISLGSGAIVCGAYWNPTVVSGDTMTGDPDGIHISLTQNGYLRASVETTDSSKAVNTAKLYVSYAIPNEIVDQSAEVQDIRIGADGTTYPTAGDAVRGQVSDLKQDLDELNANVRKKIEITSTESGNVFLDYPIQNGETYKFSMPYDSAYGCTIQTRASNKTTVIETVYTGMGAGIVTKFTASSDAPIVCIYFAGAGAKIIIEAVDTLNYHVSDIEHLHDVLENDLVGQQNLLANVVWTYGKSIGADGSIGDSNAFRISDYIPITDGNYELSFVLKQTGFYTRIHGYDSNRDWSEQIIADNSGSLGDNVVMRFSCENISYLRISTRNELSSDLRYLIKDRPIHEITDAIVLNPITMKNGFIATHNGTQTVSLTVNASDTYKYAIIECQAGDVFTVNAKGGNTARACTFIDSSNKLLQMSAINEEVHWVVKAPANASKLIINDSGSFISYIGVEPVALCEKDHSILDNYPISLGSKNWIARLGWDTEDTFGTGTPPLQSIASYKLAYENNCRIMLCDLRKTADDIFICWHDADLQNYVKHTDNTALSSAEKAQLVADLTLSELNVYDYGISAGMAYAGTKILQLSDFLRFCSYSGCIAVIELKITLDATAINDLAYEINKYNMGDRVIIFSAVNRILPYTNEWLEALPKMPFLMLTAGSGGGSEDFSYAKTVATAFSAEGIESSIWTNDFSNFTSTQINEWISMGCSFAFGEIKSLSDLQTLYNNGNLDYVRFIISSYVNIADALKNINELL